MLAVNREQKQPSEQEITQMFQELEVFYLPSEAPEINQLLESFKEIYLNGDAEFARFQLSNHPVLDWFGSRHRLNDIHFFERFLTMKAVKEALPSLEIQFPLWSSLNLQEDTSAFTFDGELAQMLFQGGAYTKFLGTAQQAKALGINLCQTLFNERYDEIILSVSYEPWSKWFGGVTWDRSWFGVDKRNNQVWLLCVTDTD
ncbi:conserved hypothetical protein [Gloeothece citriformis PCC 7424]|uniref:Group-specific protein n=1 Tax=Gloeothece citriformis (strain PCC 7424) TaxID=65393 RepID=B7KAK4_GLOC7|nr:hypothetical protein [Gloeothece citriformis]ACK68676.1 conserved hypothetical protein [Gloeothece citriformis PCC 7424]